MKARVIVSTTERKTSPWISFILSLAVPGLGEVYAGTPLSGIIFSLSRIIGILATPFYSYINSNESMAEEILAVIILCLAITFFSALHAFYTSRKRKALLSWYNSAAFYSVFAFINILLTVVALGLFLSFFDIKKIREDSPPLFRRGDLIAVKKITPSGYSNGDIVAVETDAGEKLLRIIGVPGESISYEKGRFLSDNSELTLSIFTEEDLIKLSLTDFDVVSEQNGGVRYPVKNKVSVNTAGTLLPANEFFLAPDIRVSPEFFVKTASAKIHGRVEGILFSYETGLLPGEMSLPAENTLTGK